VQLGVPIHVACCTHEAGPPVCWCRKPLPGLMIEFAARESVSLEASAIVGASAADRTMASRLGMSFHESKAFFAAG
jgi:histidinol phosphatase-like enzyme